MSGNQQVTLANRAATLEADQLQKLHCTTCNGPLQVEYVKVKRGSLHVECPKCGWRFIGDGLDAEPPWVAVLGPKVTTKGRTRVAAVSRPS